MGWNLDGSRIKCVATYENHLIFESFFFSRVMVDYVNKLFQNFSTILHVRGCPQLTGWNFFKNPKMVSWDTISLSLYDNSFDFGWMYHSQEGGVPTPLLTQKYTLEPSLPHNKKVSWKICTGTDWETIDGSTIWQNFIDLHQLLIPKRSF